MDINVHGKLNQV